mgnify:CR=1 FL=1
MFCRYCGEQIDDDCTVCPKCGGSVGPRPVNEETPNQFSGENCIASTVKGKNKLVAGIFGILLGGIGIHHFYLGNIGPGIASILFSWTGIPALIGLIQGIIILVESDYDFAKRIKN